MSNQTTRIGIALVCLTAMVLGTGCGPKKVSLPGNYYDDADRKVAVVVIEPAMGGIFKLGSEGLLDMAINDAVTKDLRARLADLQGSNAMLYLATEMLEAALDTHGVDASVGSAALAADSLPLFEGGNNVSYGRLDARQIAETTGADEVLLLDLNQWGLTRKYYGFIAIGPPEAHARLQGLLLDAEDNSVVYRYVISETRPISGKWDQPPQFGNAVQAISANLVSAMNVLLEDLDLGTQKGEATRVVELLDAPAGSYVAGAAAVAEETEEPAEELPAATEAKHAEETDVRETAETERPETEEPAETEAKHAEETDVRETAETERPEVVETAPVTTAAKAEVSASDDTRGQAIDLYLSRCDLGNDDRRRNIAGVQYDQLVSAVGYEEETILSLAGELPEGCEYVSFKIAIMSMAADQ